MSGIRLTRHSAHDAGVHLAGAPLTGTCTRSVILCTDLLARPMGAKFAVAEYEVRARVLCTWSVLTGASGMNSDKLNKLALCHPALKLLLKLLLKQNSSQQSVNQAALPLLVASTFPNGRGMSITC
jgi:hypothetical protein